MSTRLKLYGRASFVLALFLVPIAFNRNLADPFGMPKLVACWTLFGVSLGLLALRGRPSIPWPRVGLAAGAFLAANLVAAYFSEARRMSLFGLSGRYGGIAPLLVLMCSSVLMVALFWNQPGRTRHVASAVWLSAVLVAAYAVLQQAGLDPYHWYQADGAPPRYPASTMGNSNFAGALLAIALPLGVYLAATAARRRRPWLVLAISVDVLGLWYTQSRGAFVAAIVGVGTVAWISRDRVGRRRRLQMLACGGGTALILAGALVVLHPWSAARPNSPEAPLLNTTSAVGRLGYWKVASEVFVEHPLVGTGPETFYETYPLHRRLKQAADGSFPAITDKPHNVFLEYAADTGILGLGAYLALVGTALLYGYRRCRELQGEQRLALAAFVGMLVAYLAQASVSIDVPALALMGWVSIGAIATLADPNVVQRRALAAGEMQENRATSSWRAMGLRTGTVMGALLLLVGGLGILRADANASEGRLDRAAALNPLQSDYPYFAGLTALSVAAASTDPHDKVGHLEMARRYFEKTLDTRPNEWPVMQSLAATYTMWAESVDPGRYRDAIVWRQRALERDPSNVTLRQADDMANAKARADVSRLNDAAASRPDDGNGWLMAAKGSLAIGDRAQATAALERALSINPTDQEAKALLASIPR